MSSVRHVRERCVVVVGKCGVGKSTIANHLVGHDPLSPHKPPFGVTDHLLRSVASEVHDQLVEFEKGGYTYRVRVVDTVGLFDTRGLEGNDPIFDKIERYFKEYDLPGINLILFVFKKGRTTQEEKEVFEFVRSKFKQEISPISALAVTSCEADSPEQRATLVREFSSDPVTAPIARQMGMGVYPVGFPPLQSMLPRLRPAYQEGMKEDEETLRDLIIRADKPHLTEHLFEQKIKVFGCTLS